MRKLKPSNYIRPQEGAHHGACSRSAHGKGRPQGGLCPETTQDSKQIATHTTCTADHMICISSLPIDFQNGDFAEEGMLFTYNVS